MITIMSVFGTVTNPLQSIGGGYASVNTGLPNFISNVIKLVFVAAGIYAFFNLLIAGFTYITAAGDKQKIETALLSINMSLVGLIIMVSAGVLTGIISFLLYKDPTAILNPTILGPGSY